MSADEPRGFLASMLREGSLKPQYHGLHEESDANKLNRFNCFADTHLEKRAVGLADQAVKLHDLLAGAQAPV